MSNLRAHGSVGLPTDARRTGGAWVVPCACVRQHFADADVTVMTILCSPHVCLTNVNYGVSAQMGQFYVAVYTRRRSRPAMAASAT